MFFNIYLLLAIQKLTANGNAFVLWRHLKPVGPVQMLIQNTKVD
jgi:hypothetical protein